MLARARMHVLSRGPVRGLTLALGAAAVAVGVLMTAGRQWAAAVMSALVGGLVTWLAGVWVVPGGEDAYCTRIGRSVREGVGRMAGSYETFERYARRQKGRLDRLKPPPELQDEHARLIDSLDEADRTANDPSLSLKARAANTTRSLQGAREQRAALSNRRDDANRRYAKAIADLTASSDSLVAGAFDRAEEGVEAMVAKLERTDPPTKLASRRDALLEGSRDYLEAMRAYHEAVRELDPDRVADAVSRCEAAKSAIKEKLIALCGDTTPMP